MEKDDIGLVGVQRAPGFVGDFELGEGVFGGVNEIERFGMMIDMIGRGVRTSISWLGATFLVFRARAARRRSDRRTCRSKL